MTDTPTREELADRICRDVADLPDRTSPDDQPEMMLVTGEELHGIVMNALEATTLPPAAAGGGWRQVPPDTCPVCNGDCAGANPPVTFCPMRERNASSVPKDGSWFLAAVAVYSCGKFIDWDVHVISVDDETGDVHPDAYQGWNLSDYTLWQPIIYPPHPDTEDGRLTDITAKLDVLEGVGNKLSS